MFPYSLFAQLMELFCFVVLMVTTMETLAQVVVTTAWTHAELFNFYAQNNSTSVLEECRNCTGIKGEKVDAKRQHRFLILASFAYDVGYGWTTR